jgi:hypothetical protein
MKNCLTANVTKRSRYKLDKLKVLLDAQILNSLGVGWKPEDIILATNFDYEFCGVKSHKIEFNPLCPTASKMYGVRYALKECDVLWAHDLDAWQNVWFECPDIKDVGAATYDNRKFNGGSLFWRKSATDLVDEVIGTLESEKATYEENVLNRVLKKHTTRVTKLNFTYNVGCSNYRGRWGNSDKPIKVAHFHPYNRIAWETHALDRCQLGVKGISDRLERVLRNHYELATELKGKHA